MGSPLKGSYSRGPDEERIEENNLTKSTGSGGEISPSMKEVQPCCGKES